MVSRARYMGNSLGAGAGADWWAGQRLRGGRLDAVDRSGELKFDLASAATNGADDDLHVVSQLCHQFQQLGFADASKLPAGDA